MRSVIAAASLATLLGALAAAARRLDVVEVRGRSMAPTLLPGDRLLLVRAPPRRDDVVVTHDPRDGGRELVKRVHDVRSDGVVLRGDNPAASTDARSFGAVPSSAVSWRAALRYWPLRRVGRIPSRPDAFVALDEGGEPACAFPDALVVGPVDDEPATVS